MLTVRFSREVEILLHRTFIDTRGAGGNTITIEHLALQLLTDDEVARYLSGCGTDVRTAIVALKGEILKLPRMPPGEYGDTQPDREFQDMMTQIIQDAEKERRPDILVSDVFLAIVDRRKGCAANAILEATPNPEVFEQLRTFRKERQGAV